MGKRNRQPETPTLPGVTVVGFVNLSKFEKPPKKVKVMVIEEPAPPPQPSGKKWRDLTIIPPETTNKIFLHNTPYNPRSSRTT